MYEVAYLGHLSSAVPGYPVRALLVGIVPAVFALNTLKKRHQSMIIKSLRFGIGTVAVQETTKRFIKQ